jgi:hypothetical protein
MHFQTIIIICSLKNIFKKRTSKKVQEKNNFKKIFNFKAQFFSKISARIMHFQTTVIFVPLK